MENNEVDSVLEGLTEIELRDLVVRTVKEINYLKTLAKDYAKSTREQIKSLELRSEQAIALMDQKKAEVPA